jgi:hypothetical protein
MLHPRAMLRSASIGLLATLLGSPLLARGAVEIDTGSAAQIVSTRQLQELPVSRDVTELLRTLPNAAGVATFTAEPGTYAIDLGGDAGKQTFEVRDGELNSFRYAQSSGLTRLDTALDGTYLPLGGRLAPGYSFDYRLENHLTTIDLGTPFGKLYVSGPEILQRGAPSTWTSTFFAAGDSPKQRQRNEDKFRDLRLTLSGKPFPPAPAALELALDDFAQIELDDHGKPVASGSVPALWGTSQAGVLQVIAKQDPIVFAGGGVSLFRADAFDGRAGNTRLTFNGAPLRVAAESPFAVSFYTPTDWTGRGEVGIEENGAHWTVPVRNVGLSIWADKVNLIRGESSVCHIKLTGLKGLEGTVQLQVVNRTPGVITLARGNQPVIPVDPNALTRPDELQIDRPFIGVQRGQFHIQATLLQN